LRPVWYVTTELHWKRHNLITHIFDQPLPLMNIVFGSLVGEFNGYFMPGTTVTEAQFKASVNKLRYEVQKRDLLFMC
jgi:hypothetical protein